MAITSLPRFGAITAQMLFNSAMQALETAAAELDQAHAGFKDLGLHLDQPRHGKCVESLSHYTFELLEYLRTVKCEECDKVLSENELCLRGRCHVPEGAL